MNFKHLLFATVFAALPLRAQHSIFQSDDIIAGGQTPAITIASGRFDWFLSDGTLNRRMATTFGEFPFDFAFDAAGRLYSPTFFTVRVFNPSGSFVGNFGNFPAKKFVAINFDRSGNVFIAAGTSTGNLVKADANGNLLATFLLPNDGLLGGSVASIDLASDQCTFFYSARSKTIFRYDVCSRTPLSDLISSLPGSSADRIRILPDGSVLVADTESIYRVNSAGSIVQTYDVSGQDSWSNLALTPDGRFFWATSFDMAFQFNLQSGTMTGSFQSSDYIFDAMAVVGEPRAAVPSPASVPTLTWWMLAALAITLAALGASRRLC